MVAQERIKCAEMEEELKQTQREKDAMKSAMRIVEQENESLKKSKQEEKQRVGNLDIVNSIARALREDSHKSDPPSPLRPRTPATHEPESELDSEPQVTPLIVNPLRNHRPIVTQLYLPSQILDVVEFCSSILSVARYAPRGISLG